MTPYFEDSESGIVIYHGDCRDVLPTLEPVDLVLTDPPYGMNNDNNYSRFTQGLNGHRVATTRSYPPTTGDRERFMPSHLLDFPKVILWGSNYYAQRLPVGTTLVWLKRNVAAFGTFLSDAEIGWMKGGHGVYCFRDMSMYSKPEKRRHPNEKPLPLLRWCLSMAKPTGIVVDPYAGSGSVGAVCKERGLPCVLIEIEERYCEIAARRIMATPRPLFTEPAPEPVQMDAFA